MCGGIAFLEQKMYFPNPKAQLPVRLRNGEVDWQPWGRREPQTGRLPLGGWARLESIKTGRWQSYQPRPVLILAQAYMEKDAQRQSHWFDLSAHTAIQGLLALSGTEQRVYVVTVPSPENYAHIHHRWPRIINRSS